MRLAESQSPFPHKSICQFGGGDKVLSRAFVQEFFVDLHRRQHIGDDLQRAAQIGYRVIQVNLQIFF